MDDHNDELHKTEPEVYDLLTSKKFRRTPLGGREFDVGFCTNSPGADGYCDRTGFLWVGDSISDPATFIRVTLHEGLHGMFPEWSEEQVDRASTELAALVVGMFTAKDVELPELTPLADVLPVLSRVLPCMRDWYSRNGGRS